MSDGSTAATATAAVAVQPAPVAKPPLPWRRGVAWLLFLGPFFFLSYGFANWWAGSHGSPRTLVYAWERQIPFIPWTIVPYWSIDLLYGFSFLLCRDRRAVDDHARRLLTAQLVAIVCFIAFPLRFSFARPAADGLFGDLFAALASFDQPFNQAPSLHIALLVILWVRYAAASRGVWRVVVDIWAALIGVSVLTTYQHHFIDVPTGALLGFFCLWLWPDHGPTPVTAWSLSSNPQRRRLARRYLLGAASCALLALPGGTLLWLLWPALSLLLVALIYLGIGADGFQKQDGRHSHAVRWLLAPYIAAAWLNSRLWTRRHPQPDEIVDGVWLGRMPSRRDMSTRPFAAVLDLSAELSPPSGPWIGQSLPWLDLVPADAAALRDAAARIEALRGHGPLLVCCALGYSRSASAVAAWLLLTGRVASVDAAIALIAARRPCLVLGPQQRAGLAGLLPLAGEAVTGQ